MLKEPLHQRYVKAVCIVDFRCVPLAEAVGTDTLVPQIIADNVKLLLDCPLRDGEDAFRAPDAIAQTVVLNVLLNHKRHGEDSALPGFLLHDLQMVAVTVPDDIA